MRTILQLAAIAVLATSVLYGWAMLHPATAPLTNLPGMGMAGGDGDMAADTEPPRRSARTPLVVSEPVGSGVVNDRLSAIGTAESARSVNLRPLAAGRIDAIEVVSGSSVTQGDVLLKLDSEVEALEVERARIASQDAGDTLKRFESLFARNTMSSVEVERARLELEKAGLELREAEINLERRIIRAPFDGVIGILAVDVGDYVTPQDELVTIDDRSSLEVEFFAPERFARVIEVGAPVEAAAIADPGRAHEGRITAIDNRIDPQSRTLRLRASLPNPEDRLRAGMAFRIIMRFSGETYPAVPPLAVNWDSAGSYVWALRDGIAERIPAAIIQRNAESVLVDAALEPGEMVVTEGVQSVRQGAKVRVADSPADSGGMTAPAATRGGSGS